MFMKQVSSRFLTLLSGVLLSAGILLISGITLAQQSLTSKVPTQYFANYHIHKDWQRLLELFIDIDAENKI